MLMSLATLRSAWRIVPLKSSKRSSYAIHSDMNNTEIDLLPNLLYENAVLGNLGSQGSKGKKC